MKDTVITKEISRVINENISEVELGVFKNELNRLQAMEVDYVKLREDFKSLTESYKELIKISDERKFAMRDYEQREKDLKKREVEMTEQKTKLHIDNQLIELKLENANKRVEDHKAMVHTIFRGPVLQKTIYQNGTRDVVSSVVVDENGQSHYPQRDTLNTNNNTTITEKEE